MCFASAFLFSHVDVGDALQVIKQISGPRVPPAPEVGNVFTIINHILGLSLTSKR